MSIKQTLKLQKKKRKLDKKIGKWSIGRNRLQKLINKRAIVIGLLERSK